MPVFQIRIHLIRIWIRIQHLGWIPVRIQSFDNQKLEKIYTWNFFFFFNKIAIYPSLGIHKGGPSYRRSLQPSRENIQHLFYFCGSFLPSWIRIWIQIHPLTWLNQDPIRIQTRNTGQYTLANTVLEGTVRGTGLYRWLTSYPELRSWFCGPNPQFAHRQDETGLPRAGLVYGFPLCQPSCAQFWKMHLLLKFAPSTASKHFNNKYIYKNKILRSRIFSLFSVLSHQWRNRPYKTKWEFAWIWHIGGH